VRQPEDIWSRARSFVSFHYANTRRSHGASPESRRVLSLPPPSKAHSACDERVALVLTQMNFWINLKTRRQPHDSCSCRCAADRFCKAPPHPHAALKEEGSTSLLQPSKRSPPTGEQ